MIYLYDTDGDKLYICRCQLVEGDVSEECVTLAKGFIRLLERLDTITDINELQIALSNLYLGLS